MRRTRVSGGRGDPLERLRRPGRGLRRINHHGDQLGLEVRPLLLLQHGVRHFAGIAVPADSSVDAPDESPVAGALVERRGQRVVRLEVKDLIVLLRVDRLPEESPSVRDEVENHLRPGVQLHFARVRVKRCMGFRGALAFPMGIQLVNYQSLDLLHLIVLLRLLLGKQRER